MENEAHLEENEYQKKEDLKQIEKEIGIGENIEEINEILDLEEEK